MSCGCGCISRTPLCIGENNNKRFVFSIFDQDDNEMPIDGSAEIVFTVSDGIEVGGNVLAGGTVRITKRLTLGDVIIAGTGYQAVVDITPVDTASLVKSRNYYDLTVTTSNGMNYTVVAGVFELVNTNAGI